MILKWLKKKFILNKNKNDDDDDDENETYTYDDDYEDYTNFTVNNPISTIHDTIHATYINTQFTEFDYAVNHARDKPVQQAKTITHKIVTLDGEFTLEIEIKKKYCPKKK
jgi:hypothetical protein